jgi:transcriptional regulator with XRE-family HTH domain
MLPSGSPRRRVTLQCGLRIRTLRMQQRLTLDVLAVRTGLSKSSLSKIENGLVNVPLRTLDRIVAALGVSVRDLFPGEAAPPVSVEDLSALIPLLRDLLALYQQETALAGAAP